MNLYEITEEFRSIERMLEESGGEETPEIADAIRINRDEFDRKFDGYCKIIKGLEAEAETLSIEADRLNAKEKTARRKISYLKETLKEALRLYGEQGKGETFKYKNALFSAWTTQREKLQLVSAELLPEEFLVTEVVKRPDIEKIRAALDANKTAGGCQIIKTNSLTIR